MKIYVSPSTQDHNVGAGKYGTEEHEMNKLADIVIELLQQNGFETKRNNPQMNLTQVVADSNSWQPDLHIALHSNASNGKARGCEVWYYEGSAQGMALAATVYDELSIITPSTDRGIHATKSFYELSHTKAPAIIVEVAFHDNIEDANWIMSHQDAIAAAIVKGICKYVGREFKQKELLYRVVIGEWHSRDAAAQICNALKARGYSPWIESREIN